MASPGFWYRLAARACCLLAVLSSLRAAAPTGAHPAHLTLVAAYAASGVYYHAWLNGQVDAPPPARAFPQGTATVAYYVSFREAIPSQPVGRLYDARGALLETSGDELFGPSLCIRHACMDSFNVKPAFAAGGYRIEVLIGGAIVASIGFTVGRPVPRAPSGHQPNGYQVKAFYTTTAAAADAAMNTGNPPARTAAFQGGVATIAYWVSVKGRVAHTHYQVTLSLQGAGVVYTSAPASLLPSGVTIGANDVYTASKSSGMTSGSAFPAGAYRLDLLLDGKKAATTTFTVGAS